MSVRDLKAVWENLGRTDPLWAVLSEPERRHGAWDLAEFMATGRAAVDHVLELVRSHDLSLGERVLDFGCGVGRLSNALCEHDFRVVGVDIAASMIERANAHNMHPERLDFVAYDGGELPFPDDSFDAAVTLIVLQHARPREQVGALLQLQRVVRPGGLLVVQVPSRVRQVAPVEPAGRRADIAWLRAPAELATGAGAIVRARLTNVGDRTWRGGQQIKLGNHWYLGERLVVRDDGRTDLPHDVAPGEACDLDLLVTAPATPGEYRLELDVVQEFVAWWADFGSLTTTRTVRVDGAAAPAATEPPVTEPARPQPAGIEMHGMPTELLRSLLTHCGHEVIAAVPDTWSGPEWESFTYLVRIGE